jgi:hypothetical protein
MEVDHIFILCSAGGPEADALTCLGLVEGSANSHLGQGTACRRFFFRSSYLELLWVHDAGEAQNASTGRTRLWERWSRRGDHACPFGVILRPGSTPPPATLPFPTWSYRPAYLPPDLSIEIAVDTPLTEPEFFYLPFQPRRARPGQEPTDHAIPVGDVAGFTIGLPSGQPRSIAGREIAAAGLLSFEPSDDHVLRLTFDNRTSGETADLRPKLPVVVQW